MYSLQGKLYIPLMSDSDIRSSSLGEIDHMIEEVAVDKNSSNDGASLEMDYSNETAGELIKMYDNDKSAEDRQTQKLSFQMFLQLIMKC